MRDMKKKDAPLTLIRGTAINAAATLISRILGMFRDMAMAMLFGLSAGGILDLFVLAFRLPNLFRRLFGEGVVAISFQPAFCNQLAKNKQSAWELLTAVLTVLSVLMGTIALLGMLIGGILWFVLPGDGKLLAGLTTAMLPYLFFISQTAVLAAALQAFKSYTAPAAAPLIMNAAWLAMIAVCYYRVESPIVQVYLIAGTVTFSSILQLWLQMAVLRRFGYRFQHVLTSRIRPYWRRATAHWFQMAVGLSVLQILVVSDTIFAWIACPAGAVSSVFLAERLFEFPLGLIGISVATAVYPLLNMHAATGQQAALGDDLSKALQLALILGIPATAGLVYIGFPITQLMFEYGNVTTEDCRNIGWVLVLYSLGVWSYCLAPILVRGFYAVGKSSIPARLAFGTMAANAALDLILVQVLDESQRQIGLALSSVVLFSILTFILLYRINECAIPLSKRFLCMTLVKTVTGTVLMSVAGIAILQYFPLESSTTSRFLRVFAAFAVSLAVYFGWWGVRK